MKQMKTVLTSIIVMLAVSSCKKNKDLTTPPSETLPKLSKIEYPANGFTQTFTYNTNGRLISARDNNFILNYNYSTTPFGYEVFNSSNIKRNDLGNIVFSSNKMTSFDYRFYNSSGTLNGSETITLQYDANGYQTHKAYPGYVYTSTISAGNTVVLTQTNTSTGTIRTTTIEYYTDKPNKLNINLFEYWYLDHILSDMEATGKKNVNLPKKITYSSATYNQLTEFVYETDTNGLLKKSTATVTSNGGTPVVSVANYSYL